MAQPTDTTKGVGSHGRGGSAGHQRHSSGRGKSSRRGKHPSGLEFSNRHQTNKMVKELCHVISCYRHLTVGLGSSGDGWQLRSDLTCLRLLISHLIKVIRVTLEAHTRKWMLYKEGDRRELIRISNIYYSCVTTFIQDMRRSLELHEIFVISDAPPVGFINTGVSGYHSLMLSEREFGDSDGSGASITAQIQHTVKDIDTIAEEIKNLPWYTLTWAPAHANNASRHETVSIEEDQALLLPGVFTSRWFLAVLIATIVLVVGAVLVYTLVLSLQ